MKKGEKMVLGPKSKHSAVRKLCVNSRVWEYKSNILTLDHAPSPAAILALPDGRRKDSVWAPTALELPSYSQRRGTKERSGVFLL